MKAASGVKGARAAKVDTTQGPLRIGLSARLMHRVPAELGFRDKTLQYLEQSAAHWIMRHGAMALMVPTLGFDAQVERRRVSVRHYVDALDGLVMQGGADVSPNSYGQQPLRPQWTGDLVRDRYEMELLEGFLAQGKPVLGICRGCQLLNVFFGGTLHQDIATQQPTAQAHVDPVAYDKHVHDILFEPQSRLAELYAGRAGVDGVSGGLVTSIHHQAVDKLGGDLVVEALSAEDGIVEAIRARGASFVAGVQWHPEFHHVHPELLDPEPLMEGFLAAARARRG